MGQITTLFVHKVLGIASKAVDKADVLRSVGIPPDSPVDPKKMISDLEYYNFLERLAKEDGDGTTLPLRAGAAMRCDDYGALGLAMKSALTLRGTYDRAERYGRVLTNVAAYPVEETDGGAYIHLRRSGERRLGMRLSNEATIASLTQIAREVSATHIQPLSVYFKHSAPTSTAAHEDYFGCPAYFDSDRDALLLSSELLQTPNRLGDAGVSKFFETHLESELAQLSDEGALDKQIRMHISQSLSEGIPKVSDIAGQLGMSARTLQRRLSEQGYSYQTLVDESRRELSRRLLSETEFPLIDIAFMTGFSEQSAFNRAFKRWAGQTPRSYRIQFQTP